MKLLAKASVIGLSLASCLTASASYPVVCSAFDSRGDAATVTLAEQKLLLKITRASGGSLALTTSVSEAGLLRCNVFFDKDDNYAAVGLSHLGLKTGPLRIVVADLTSGKLIGDFVVPSGDLGASPKLAGFFQDKPTLVVFGTGAPDHPEKAFSTALYRVDGEQEVAPETRRLPPGAGSVGNVSFVDPVHAALKSRNDASLFSMVFRVLTTLSLH